MCLLAEHVTNMVTSPHAYSSVLMTFAAASPPSRPVQLVVERSNRMQE